MLTLAAIFLIPVPRTAPIGFENGFLGIEMKPVLYGPSAQIGKIQVATWSGSSVGTTDYAKAVQGWEQPDPKFPSYQRRIRGVTQSVYIGRGESGGGFGSGSVTPQPRTTIVISERPPEGVVPSDWPIVFKRGIFRILPNQLSIIKNLDPIRLSTNETPAGDMGEGVYHIPGTLDEIDATLKRTLTGWQRYRLESEVSYSYRQELPRREGLRRLFGVTAMIRDQRLQLTIRWKPINADMTRFQGLRQAPNSEDQPASKIPALLVGKYGRAWKYEFGDGRIGWAWTYPLHTSMSALAKKLASHGIDHKASEDYISMRISQENPSTVAHISRGRTVVRKEVPAGWKKTADFAGFVDYVVQDRSTYVTVRLEELTKPAR